MGTRSGELNFPPLAGKGGKGKVLSGRTHTIPLDASMRPRAKGAPFPVAHLARERHSKTPD